MDFSEIMQFRGTWRSYQARVLQNSEKYRKDGHIHIVAAPGSGKTTLGIELIRRTGEPTLILAPSITIREQWVARMQEAFLKEGVETDRYISQNLKDMKLITVATYQALHSAMTRRSSKGKNPSGGQETEERDHDRLLTGDEWEATAEETDYTGFDLISALQQAGIGVLCLDECHHLRSEWWKALEDLRGAYPVKLTIALTATPPYDSTPALWMRYMNMCGEIDEEITIPELVKEGSLCPHQDYVYFNYPTKDEREAIAAFEEKSRSMLAYLMADGEFAAAIRTHRLMTGEVTDDQLLDRPEYLAALIIFYEQKGIAYPGRLKQLLGARYLPVVSEKWMGILLQGFLYDDCDAYSVDKVYREELIRKLKAQGLVEKRKVCLVAGEAISRMLVNSRGKINSIREIAFGEYHSLKQELRMLVLTDYIRRETEKNLGTGTDVNLLGVLPFFEMLRMENEKRGEKLRLGVLCGSVVIIPAEARAALLAAAGENAASLAFSRAGELAEQDYVKVTVSGSGHFLTAAVTEIFAKGWMQVLIGTKSLLGEGWDSPCINSLILASFVGSFMLSNQMRGRAIRVLKDHPEKTSNIWHLVCLKPTSFLGSREGGSSHSGGQTRQNTGEESEDYQLLVRRMEQFLGLHYEEEYIENGIARMSIIKPPFNKAAVAGINRKMLAMAADREVLAKRWQKALAVYDRMQVVEEAAVEDKFVTVVALFDVIRAAAISTVITILGVFLFFGPYLGTEKGVFSLAVGAMTLISALVLLGQIPRLLMLGTPLGRLKAFGEGIRAALARKGLFEEEKNRCVTDQGGATLHAIYLSGGSGRDKALFARCVFEFFEEVDNQRYLLVKKKGRHRADRFFCVPECFAKKKEDAEFFAACLRPYVGEYEPVYTRNREGRELLLKGRVEALANRENRCLTRKRVKGALE